MFNVGIIGLGWWGPKLLRNFRDHPRVEHVIGIDRRIEVAGAIHEEYKVPVATDPIAAIREGKLDAVVVATPPQSHFKIAKEALLSGCHVLLTKPPTKTIDELKALMGLARERNLTLMMDSTFVYSNHLAKVKELLGIGLLEDIRYVQSARFGNDMHFHHISRIRDTMFANKLDVIEDLFFHDAAILIYLFGSELKPITVNRHYILHRELCDTAFINLDIDPFEAQVGLSWTLPERKRDLIIYGANGYLKFDDLSEEPKIVFYELEPKKTSTFPVQAKEPLFNVVDHFISCISNEKTPITNGPYMLSLMNAVEAVRKI